MLAPDGVVVHEILPVVTTGTSVHDAVAVEPAVTETVTGHALYPLRANVTVCDPAETFVSVTGVITPVCNVPSSVTDAPDGVVVHEILPVVTASMLNVTHWSPEV